jgi:hypothetical protein
MLKVISLLLIIVGVIGLNLSGGVHEISTSSGRGGIATANPGGE